MPRKKKEEEPKVDDIEGEIEESADEEEEGNAKKGKRSTRGAGRNDGKWRKLGKEHKINNLKNKHFPLILITGDTF